LQTLIVVAQVGSGAAFIFYGFACLFSQQMVEEFSRYRLSSFRSLTGVLEVAGGLGLLLGFYYYPLLLFSSAGLATLMAMGVVVRIRIADSLPQMLPAIILFALNAFIFFASLYS
jgi:hypothetical protein